MFTIFIPFIALVGFFGLFLVVENLFDLDLDFFFSNTKLSVVLGIVMVLIGVRVGMHIDKSMTGTTLDTLNSTYYEVSVYSGGEEVYHTGNAVGLSTGYGRVSFFDVEVGQRVSAYGTIVIKRFTEEGEEDDEL